jgi:oxygen-independent coproporphyrinogen-3 oxidase
MARRTRVLEPALVAKYDTRVPRYTSYPTAPHFHAGIGAEAYLDWLSQVPAEAGLSLYLHIPFCDSLCWFCGCHTKVVRRYHPVELYLEALRREIDVVAEALHGRGIVHHTQWGGGTPTILEADDLEALARYLKDRFRFAPEAEFAVEIDPREMTADRAAALARGGVNRASLGVQDVNPDTQRAINRWQPVEVTQQVVDWLREAGIEALNIDLMYGLPHQTTARVVATVEATLALEPRRIALFGYAHVPWMKRHQRLIDEAQLADASQRLEQLTAAGERLEQAGYVAIGLDHFARPDDTLALALGEGRLHRNFQGYTTDPATTLLGFGASAIGGLAQGYVQNEVDINAYREAARSGVLPVVRGIEISDEDRLRRAIIERLMCDMGVDLEAVCARFGQSAERFAPELARLEAMARDGIVSIEGARVTLPAHARPLLRTVCAVFDQYLEASETRHARAV